jgi:hypothetical protein
MWIDQCDVVLRKEDGVPSIFGPSTLNIPYLEPDMYLQEFHLVWHFGNRDIYLKA